jgi:DnaJ family protein C protein 8
MLSAEHTIRAILRASNHFDALRLPKPHADLMEQPVWDVEDDAISRAYRKLSLVCHPDKSAHADAPRAWDVLKRAKQCLLDPLERDDYLMSFLKGQKTHWEGTWTSSEAATSAKERTATMRDAAKNEHGESVADAMRERHEKAVEAARRKERLQAAKLRAEARRSTPDAAIDNDDDNDDNDDRSVNAASPAAKPSASGGSAQAPARKRPKFL